MSPTFATAAVSSTTCCFVRACLSLCLATPFSPSRPVHRLCLLVNSFCGALSPFPLTPLSPLLTLLLHRPVFTYRYSSLAWALLPSLCRASSSSACWCFLLLPIDSWDAVLLQTLSSVRLQSFSFVRFSLHGGIKRGGRDNRGSRPI